MNGKFGDFFEAKTAERAAKDAEIERIEAEKRRLKEEHEQKLSKPLHDKLGKALDLAASELAEKGVKFEPHAHVSMDEKSGYIYTYFFRLQKQNSVRGITSSDTFGFRVHGNGSIEGLAADSLIHGRRTSKRIFYADPGEFGENHITELIQAAVTDLVYKLR